MPGKCSPPQKVASPLPPGASACSIVAVILAHGRGQPLGQAGSRSIRLKSYPSADPKPEIIGKEPVAAEAAPAGRAAAEIVRKVAQEFFRERAGRPE